MASANAVHASALVDGISTAPELSLAWIPGFFAQGVAVMR
jgi:hypothetical protein